jgi:hypothetical protein
MTTTAASAEPAPSADSTTDRDQLRFAASALLARREQRAQSRRQVRAQLDALAAEASRYLGEVFTANDPVTGFPVALVVRSDERLPDDYEAQTPRPLTDTVSRLVIDVLGQAITIEIDDAGRLSATGQINGTALGDTTGVRVAPESAGGATYLVLGGNDPNAKATEVPFVRILAELVATASWNENRFRPTDEPAANATAT